MSQTLEETEVSSLEANAERGLQVDAQIIEPSEPGTLRTLIADDATSARHYLRAVLDASRRFVVVGEAVDGDESVEMACALQPDIVFLDLAMPFAFGTNALRRIRVVAPNATVIVVSALDPALQVPILEAGALAFIPKGATPLEFLTRLATLLDRSCSVAGLVEGQESTLNNRAVVFADEPATRHLVTRVLDRCNIMVTAETESPTMMLEVVERTKAKIVVLGLSMRGAHDMAVVAEIRQRSPYSSIIVYSAREKWRDEALSAGAAAFVVHPRIRQLVQRIEASFIT